LNPDGRSGTTELHITHVLKGATDYRKGDVVQLPRYYPTTDDPPKPVLFFVSADREGVSVSFGVPGHEAVLEYVQGLAKHGADEQAMLGYCFQHCESKDATVAADAFLMLARAPDTALIQAKTQFDAKKLSVWLRSSDTPEERLSVYAVLLGLCGTADDRRTFETLLSDVSTARVRTNLAGILAGFVLLDTTQGLKTIQMMLATPELPFEQAYGILRAAEFLYAMHSTELRDHLLNLFKQLLTNSDVCDLMIEDLRRWQEWELTAEVLTHLRQKPSRLLLGAIARYLLCCPEPAAQSALAALRQSDPKAVARAEDSLKLLAAPKQP
jgi:hypothetical protein